MLKIWTRLEYNKKRILSDAAIQYFIAATHVALLLGNFQMFLKCRRASRAKHWRATQSRPSALAP